MLKQIVEKTPRIAFWTVAAFSAAWVTNMALIEFSRIKKSQLDLEARASDHPAAQVRLERQSREYDAVANYLKRFDPVDAAIRKGMELYDYYFRRNGSRQY